MFVHFNSMVVNADTISWIDYKNFKEHGYIRIHYLNGDVKIVDGPQAVDVLMELDPSAIEGERLKHIRHTWALHNLIGHPLMQICAWLGLHRLALWIHDMSVPNPITKDR